MPAFFNSNITSRALFRFAAPTALLMVLIAGLTTLRKPFNGDQALFITGARAMSHGAMLYRDFWDLKQPGIYGFYWLGIKLPVSPEVAVHSLELMWFAAFAGLLIASLQHWFQLPIYAALAAVLVCGLYLILSSSAELTQVEGLVNLPLYLTAWLLIWPVKSSRSFYISTLFAGAAAGCVIYFKLILIPIPIVFLILMVIRERRDRRSFFGCLLAILLFAIGTAVIVLPLLSYYRAQDQIDLLYSTFITIPMRINRELPHNPSIVLVRGLGWFVSRFGLLLPLAMIGAYRRRKSLSGWSLVLWVMLGLTLITLQGKGWGYHYLLLLTPIGILAAAGVEHFLTVAGAQGNPILRRALIAVPALSLLPYLLIGLAKLGLQLKDPRPHEYELMEKEAGVVSASNAKPGPIYVLGDPLIYYLSNRPQAVALNGWSPEWLLDNQWQELSQDLRVTRPNYIYLQTVNREPMYARGQAFEKVLLNYYSLESEDETGAWYSLRH